MREEKIKRLYSTGFKYILDTKWGNKIQISNYYY